MSSSPLNPRLQAVPVAPNGPFPNNPRLPLLVYSRVLERGEATAERFQAMFAANGWPDGWVNGIFDYHHYHSTAHEVLGVFRGEADVLFGGTAGVRLAVGPGDVVVVPAGVAHCRVEVRGRLGVVGSYPRGQSPDVRRRGGGENVPGVGLPEMDPVFGSAGPMFGHWR